jgi:hypothetical protein
MMQKNAVSISTGTIYKGATLGSTYDFDAFDQVAECDAIEGVAGNWYSFTGDFYSRIRRLPALFVQWSIL